MEPAEKSPIRFDRVADLYDYYVTVKYDIPFFLKVTEGYNKEILELMCGTGRVSIPLLEAGRKMTCVDYSQGMLDSFAEKIKNKNFSVNLVNMDVTLLNLNKKFGLIFLPFHSFSEILSAESQIKVLKQIAQHLDPEGIFILTLQNPKNRLKSADDALRILGEMPIDGNRQLIVSAMNKYDPAEKIVSGYQFYEIYSAGNMMMEKRVLEIHFRPLSDSEIREMLGNTGFRILEVYGDYSGNPFDEETSDFMIYRLGKEVKK